MTSLLKKSKSISLYHYEQCPFCAKTRRVIDELDLDVELKNIKKIISIA
ncbi:MAG: glutaredoxin [Colwellia sp.]|jgi:glutaredoxin